MLLSKDELKLRFSKPLPGIGSHLKMAPAMRAQEVERLSDKIQHAKLSAVLILLFPEDSRLKTVFIKRSEYDGVHSGQIAFPGGQKEVFDKSFEDTALREAQEEIGIKPTEIEILTQLSDLFIPPSNFLVKVFVGYSEQKPVYTIDPKEVQSVVEVNLEDFYSENIITEKEFASASRGIKIKAPCFTVNNIDIWGATAMIMRELLDVLKIENKEPKITTLTQPS